MAQREDTGLPASVELAWGMRARSGRGPKPGLSLERIVQAAVAIAESEGLAAVSMSRVAADVGASAMSLYRYVASKDELLMLMVDLPFEHPPTLDGDAGWRTGLTGWARAYRETLSRHPWVVRVPISGPPITPNNIAWFEVALAAMAGTELEEGEKVSTVLLLSGFVRSDATLAADVNAATKASEDLLQIMMYYGRLLDRLTDEEHHPSVRAAVAAGVFDEEALLEDEDYDFMFGLERILDGLEALMSTRRAT